MSYDKLLEETKSLSKKELLAYFRDLQEAVKYEYDLKKILNEALENTKEESVNSDKKIRRFGIGKGIVSYMAEDFDAPLDDFKDYM